MKSCYLHILKVNSKNTFLLSFNYFDTVIKDSFMILKNLLIVYSVRGVVFGGNVTPVVMWIYTAASWSHSAAMDRRRAARLA